MTDETMVPGPDDFDEELSTRVGAVNKSLEALEIKVDLWDDSSPNHFRAIVDELRDDEKALIAAARSLRAAASDEWHDVAARIIRSLERLEGEVQTAWADFEAEIAEDLDEYKAASSRQLESWRSHLDRLRVHAKLAEMDTRDAVGEMEQAFDAAKPELERARGAAEEALEAMRATGREFVMHLRKTSREATRKMS